MYFVDFKAQQVKKWIETVTQMLSTTLLTLHSHENQDIAGAHGPDKQPEFPKQWLYCHMLGDGDTAEQCPNPVMQWEAWTRLGQD